jgi:hypothetical protein
LSWHTLLQTTAGPAAKLACAGSLMIKDQKDQATLSSGSRIKHEAAINT